MKKIYNISIRICISLLILGLFFYYVGIEKIYLTITSINLIYIFPILILQILALIAGGFCISILIIPLNKKISSIKIIKYYMLSWTLGLIAPGKLGELSLLYFLKRIDVPLGKGTFILFIDKTITMGSIFLISTYGLFLFFDKIIAIKSLIFFLIILLSLIGIFISDTGRYLIKKIILRKHSIKFEGFSKTMKTYFKHKKRYLLLNALTTLTRYFLISFIIKLLFLSFGETVAITTVIIITMLIVLLSMIPITFSGIGLREASAVFLYGVVGIKADIVAAVYVIIFIINYSSAALIALVLFNYIKIKDPNIIKSINNK